MVILCVCGSRLGSFVGCAKFCCCDFVTLVLVCEGPQKTVLFTVNYFFVVTFSTPILFFYLWTFPLKIVDFVTQIAKFIQSDHYFSKSADRLSKSTDQKLRIWPNLLSYLWTFFNRYLPTFTNIHQMLPNPTHVEPVSFLNLL
jgi:hypothetical protein